LEEPSLAGAAISFTVSVVSRLGRVARASVAGSFFGRRDNSASTRPRRQGPSRAIRPDRGSRRRATKADRKIASGNSILHLLRMVRIPPPSGILVKTATTIANGRTYY
jgi:hypothetical protein